MTSSLLRALLLGLGLCGSALAADPARSIDIPAGPLAGAISTLADQTGLQLLYDRQLLEGRQAPALQGSMSPREALDKLLQGSGIGYRFTDVGSVALTSAQGSRGNTLDEVLVTGQRLGEGQGYAGKTVSLGKQELNPRQIPNSVSVLTRQQMDDQDMTNITQAMQQMTGVNVIANDTTNNQYYIRGYSLGVMYDGVSSYNGMTPSHQFDLPLYERIEVLRGPAGLLRGVGEPGGVVNLVKKRPRKEFGFSWAASAGSWNNYRVEGDVTGPLNEDRTLRGRLVMAREDRDYFYDTTRSRKWLGMGVLEYDFSPDTTLNLSYSVQDQNVKAPSSGLPAYDETNSQGHYRLLDWPRSTFNMPDWGRMLYHTEETAARLEHRFDNQWKAQLSLNHRTQRQYYKYAYTYSGVNPVDHSLDYTSSRGDYDYTRDGLDAFVEGPFQALGRTHRLLLGFNAEVYNSKGTSGKGPGGNLPYSDLDDIVEPAIPYTAGSESETRQHGLYSQLRISLADPLTLVLGGRTTTFKVKSRKISPSPETAWADGAKADNEFTPYGGLLYDIAPGLTLYGSYADIFVPQTQLKADGGTLDPRVGRQLEVGAKGEFLDGRLAASLALFNLRDKDRAYFDDRYPSESFYLNAGEVESKGWELEVTGRPMAGLDLTAGYTYLKTRYLKDPSNEGKTYSIQTPNQQLKLWGNYRFDGQSPLAGWSLGLGLLANSKAQSSRGWRDELVNKGYAVVNSRIAWQIDRTYSLSLQVNNLFDKKYYASVGTPNIYNFYGEPRNFMLTLKADM
ncbi:TonB-dependent receptor [Azovibrio restrictus]|uniref:TonB-dependent siderophore receptor n=1 Tax=Azovibrio restrictus TaxID=146938 RepID=UPI0026EFB6D7|nr:TonB-dependent receptor [Azovibrio restrictus]MDD3482154.1 TonB-dependent siderophore receptor [Azovibrio restrictus]